MSFWEITLVIVGYEIAQWLIHNLVEVRTNLGRNSACPLCRIEEFLLTRLN